MASKKKTPQISLKFGDLIQVYWPLDDAWYNGEIIGTDSLLGSMLLETLMYACHTLVKCDPEEFKEVWYGQSSVSAFARTELISLSA
eukprot:1176830-Prorocentrum_minimum.AAC.1